MQSKTIRTLSIAFFVSALLWGAFTFLVYLGTPYHGLNLLNDEGYATVAASCGGEKDVYSTADYLCRGAAAFGPFLIRSIARMAPFLGYAAISLLAYGGFMAWRRMATREKTVTIRWTPWKFALVAFGMLWLLFTVVTWGGERNEKSVRFLVEPRSDTYTVGEQALQELQKDFTALEARDCLDEIGVTQSGAKAYLLKHSCIQAAFVSRVFPQALFVFVLLFEFLVLGRFLLGLLKLRREMTPLLEAVLSAALGAAGWIVLLWVAAVAHVFVPLLGWMLVLGVPVILFRESLHWVDRLLGLEWKSEHRLSDPVPLLFWLLLTYVLLGFLSVVRPFPIGWDDLGSYLNRPHLLVSYGKFIFSMPAFEWTYLTSLGFLLFGYDSVFGTTASMMVNWTAGLLAVTSVFVFARRFLGGRSGYLSALLYGTLPLVGHFSFADMKIDNAVFFYGALATLLAFMAFFDPEQEGEARRWTDRDRLLLLAGVFAGAAFATKVTAIMVILSLVVFIFGLTVNAAAAAGGVGLSAAILSLQGSLNAQKILDRAMGGAPASVNAIFLIMSLAIAAAGIGYGFWRKRGSRKPSLLALGAFAAGLVVMTVPWIEHNNILQGKIVPGLAFGAPNDLSPTLIYRTTDPESVRSSHDVRIVPKELRVDASSPACVSTSGTEELDRYWGHMNNWSHYLLLPWRTVMNLDSTGYYVTTIAALLLFPLVLLFPYVWTERGRWLRWLAAITGMTIVEWVFLANGVPWYGIGMFLGLVVTLEAFVVRAPDAPNRWFMGLLLGLSIVTSLGFRMGQFELQRSMYEYPMGKISASALREITIANYDDIVGIVEDRRVNIPDRPYLYRIGTFIPYFVPQNLEVLGANDQQLDLFNCLYSERDPALTVKRLKALGFNSIILDLNTATIESDQQGTLHQKVRLFQEFVNDPRSGLQVVINDERNVAFILIP